MIQQSTKNKNKAEYIYNRSKKTTNPVESKQPFNFLKSFRKSSLFVLCRLVSFWCRYFLFMCSDRKYWKHPRTLKYKAFKKEFAKIFLKEDYLKILLSGNFLNKILLYVLRLQYRLSNNENFRVNYRLNFFKKGFYMLYGSQDTQKITQKTKINTFYSGIRYFLNFFSKWLMPLLFSVSFVYYSLTIQNLPFNKVIFVWTSLFMVFYWLVSGFVFFFKKYQYSKFTSVVQRFWKRSLILFWLIEGGLLFVFVFLTLNSNSYLYNVVDQTQLFKTHLFSWKIFLLKIFPTTFLLLLTYVFLLNNKWQPLNKNIFFIIPITCLLLYIIWVEFYQFYHVMNFYTSTNWEYETLDKQWVVKTDTRRSSQTNHLVSILLILKFWHVLFIAAVWFFFVLRSEESGKSKYPLISANFLNFVMLYVLTWVYMYPWFKWFFRRFFSVSYKWFYTNNRGLSLRLFFNDLGLLFLGLGDFFESLTCYYSSSSFKNFLFFNCKVGDLAYGFVDFKKKFVTTQIWNDVLNVSTINRGSEGFFGHIFSLSKNLIQSAYSYLFYEWFLNFELYVMPL